MLFGFGRSSKEGKKKRAKAENLQEMVLILKLYQIASLLKITINVDSILLAVDPGGL